MLDKRFMAALKTRLSYLDTKIAGFDSTKASPRTLDYIKGERLALAWAIETLESYYHSETKHLKAQVNHLLVVIDRAPHGGACPKGQEDAMRDSFPDIEPKAPCDCWKARVDA